MSNRSLAFVLGVLIVVGFLVSVFLYARYAADRVVPVEQRGQADSRNH